MNALALLATAHYAIGGAEWLFWLVVVLVVLAIVYLIRRAF